MHRLGSLLREAIEGRFPWRRSLGNMGVYFSSFSLRGEKKHTGLLIRPGSINRPTPLLGDIRIDLLEVLISCTPFPW